MPKVNAANLVRAVIFGMFIRNPKQTKISPKEHADAAFTSPANVIKTPIEIVIKIIIEMTINCCLLTVSNWVRPKANPNGMAIKPYSHCPQNQSRCTASNRIGWRPNINVPSIIPMPIDCFKERDFVT